MRLYSWPKLATLPALQEGDYNVFSVDWRPLARSPWYSSAASNAAWAGEYAAEMLEVLASEAGVSWRDVHAIGASLGAHAAACAGATVRSGRIGRITGLDPSGPLYYSAKPALRQADWQ